MVVDTLCFEYDIDHHFRPRKKPQWGGHIERLLGTVASRLKQVLGAAFSSSKERGDYPSEAKAVMTLAEAEAWLARFFWGEYHHTEHSALNGLTPMERYAHGLIVTPDHLGGGAPRLCADPAKLRIDVLPMWHVSVQRNYGIRCEGLNYYDRVLDVWIHRPHPEDQKHLIRRHPDDMTRVLWFDPHLKRYLPIPINGTPERVFSELELREAKVYCNRMGWERTQDDILKARRELDEIERTAERRTMTERRTKERKYQSRRNRELESRQFDAIAGVRGPAGATMAASAQMTMASSPASVASVNRAVSETVSTDPSATSGSKAKSARPRIDLSKIVRL